MEKFDGREWGKKVYLWLSLAVVVIMAIIFFANLFWGSLASGPIEETWLGEILKYVLITLGLVLIVDVIAYPIIGTIAATKQSKNK